MNQGENMNRKQAAIWRALLVAGTLMFSAGASAQASRTWVSGVGDDANPCSRTAPCKTFAGAISKTAANGIINALDPGGFGAVTITKPITIDGGGTANGGILSASTNGIIINTPGANDVVRITNLAIQGFGTGLNGIKFLDGGILFLDNVRVSDVRSAAPNGYALAFTPSGSSQLIVSNSIFDNNLTGGAILVSPGASGEALVSIDNTRLLGNTVGLRANGRTVVSMRNSVVSGNLSSGVLAIGSSTQYSSMTLDRCMVTNNGAANASAAGVYANGELAVIRLSNNVITGNAYGIRSVFGSKVRSFGNNVLEDNSIDGNPTTTAFLR
jgi:hypothetical protein